MLISLLRPLVHLAIILPIIFLFQKKDKNNYLKLVFFSFCFLIYLILTFLPKDLYTGQAKMYGNIMGTIWAILCYIIFNKYFPDSNYFKIKQDIKNTNSFIILSIISAISIVLANIFVISHYSNIKSLLYNSLFLEISEGIMFRGVLLGLLMSCTTNKKYFINNSCILIIAILFGFISQIYIDGNYTFYFVSRVGFIFIVFREYMLGLLTIKSKSIIIPIIINIVLNLLVSLLFMVILSAMKAG